MLTRGFTNKYYNITEINQGFTPDVLEYRIKVSSDTPHWYITDYLTRISSHYGIHAIEVNGKISFICICAVTSVDADYKQPKFQVMRSEHARVQASDSSKFQVSQRF